MLTGYCIRLRPNETDYNILRGYTKVARGSQARRLGTWPAM